MSNGTTFAAKQRLLEPKDALLALGGGIAASILVAGHAPGLGVVLFVFGFAAGWIALQRPAHSLNLLLFGSLSLALYTMAFVRSAGWLVAVDLIVATLLLPVATSEAISFTELRSLTRRWLVRMPGSLIPTVKALPSLELKDKTPNWGIVRGVSLAAVPLLTFGTLFVSADRVFADLIDSFTPDFSSVAFNLSGLHLRARVFIGVIAFTAIGALCLLYRSPTPTKTVREPNRKLSSVEWITALALIDLLFVLFVIVQITVLFGGQHHVLETTGLTYAQYARSGFYQLVMVAALVLGLIALAVRWAKPSTPREMTILRALLGGLCGLTVLILVSALHRIDLLEATFGLTRIRLFGHAGSLWIAGILLIVIFAGIRWQASWLPRAVLAYSALFLLGFSAINPEGTIASYNVDRFERTGQIDTAYLASLGDDALPALAKLPQEQLQCAVRTRFFQNSSWLSTNLARSEAKDIYSDLTFDSLADCPGNRSDLS